ncbi:MAG: PqqD family protein [bacterium]
MRGRKEPIDRKAALSARPEQAPAVRTEERENGGLEVTVRVPRPRFLRWLRSTEQVEKTFGLDVVGRELYEWCDGHTSVRTLIKKFANKHSVRSSEAETAVTHFLKTLMSKGLVFMALDKKRVRRDDR